MSDDFRVLIVDDHRDCADTLARILALERFQARVAYDASSALAIAREWPPHVAVLDIVMPGMNGHELALALRSEVTPQPRFIAWTGALSDAFQDRSSELGFVEHVMKPAEPTQLLMRLRADGGLQV